MDNDFVQTIKEKRDQQTQAELAEQRQAQLVDGNTALQQAVLGAAQATIQAQTSNEPQVTIKNFPETLATSADIQKLIDALEQNRKTTEKTSENTSESLYGALVDILGTIKTIAENDHSGDVIAAIGSLEEEVKDKEMTVTNLEDLADFFFSLEQAISALEMSPQINLPAPVVKVDKPDLKPIEKLADQMNAVKEAIESIPEVEFVKLENEMKAANKTLTKILQRPFPVPNGGGSAGFQALKDFDYLAIANDTATQYTLTYKTGGSGGTTVRTLVITYPSGAGKVSDDLTSLDYSQ